MRFLIIFFVLIQGAASFAESAELLYESPVAAEAPEAATGSSDRKSRISLSYPSIDSLFTLNNPKLEKISTYQPIYFLVGIGPEPVILIISLSLVIN